MNILAPVIACVPVLLKPGFSVFVSPQIAFIAYQPKQADYLTPDRLAALLPFLRRENHAFDFPFVPVLDA